MQIFSPAHLNLEEDNNSHHSCFHQILQSEIFEDDVVRMLTFCQLLLEDPGSFSCSSHRASNVQAVEGPMLGVKTVGEEIFFLPSFLVRWLV